MKIYHWIFFIVFSIHLPLAASPIKDDEWVELMPGAAKLDADGKIHVTLSAWVHEKETRPGAQTILARWMKLDLDQLTTEERKRFEMRTQLFRVDSERNKKVTLQIGNLTTQFPRTNSSGFTSKKIQISLPEAYQYGELIKIKVEMPENDLREFSTQFPVLTEQGISIISDIDDTIKDSNVLDKQILLRNTFVNPLHAVEGMKDLYRDFAVTNKNTGFHYVSSSPIQLYSLLKEFLAIEGFPEGSLHLRQVKLWDEMFKEGSSSQRHKHQQIRQLIKDFPQRQFILIGDSGEADPEIYAEITRDYPDKIIAIAIRNVTNEIATSPRYQKTFKDITSNKWRIFSKPAEIKDLLE